MDEEDASVQTRSEENGLHNFRTVKEAFAHADQDTTVWKVSFYAVAGERVRLVREEGETRWRYEDLVEAVQKGL